MKIRRVLDKKVGETSYYKYLVTLPKDVVESSKLIDKQLQARLEKDKIVIDKKN